MDLIKLQQDFINRKYTDIEIIFFNDDNHITIHAHKIILACCSDYFDRMFNFGTEKNQNQIKINVDDIGIARDLIYSLYGIKK